MAILEKTVWITLNGRTIKHYEDIGYIIKRVKDKKGRMKVVKGTQIEVKVEDLPIMSNFKLTKICDTCNRKISNPQPYSAILISRKNGRKDCCEDCKGGNVSKGKLINLKFEDSLLYKNPLLADEWDENRNGIKASEVSAGSNKIFWWIGEKCGHKWDMAPNSRTYLNYGCPFCSGHRASQENCLATVHPDVALEWNYEKNYNLTPHDVTYGSGTDVWWKCNSCNHEWEAVVYSRTGKDKNGCPACKMSKGELRIYNLLNKRQISFSPQYTFRDLLGVGGFPLKFDFAIFDSTKELFCVIEYDGEFHFEKKYEEDSHESIVIHDHMKNEYCIKNSIPLIRIPYWEFDNIEDILNKELNKLNITF